jgi:hypothetical protein
MSRSGRSVNGGGGGEVRVQLHGGLGNQLFQAACGLALARRHRARLSFDISRFRDKGLRGYALDGLPIAATVMPPQKMPLVSKLVATVDKARGGIGVRRPAGWYAAIHAERQFHFDPAVLDLKPDILLAGFFQSPRYFADAETEVRAAFDATALMPEPVRAFGARLAETPSVSVHLRRGDFAASATTQAVHGVLDMAYYQRAVALIRRVEPGVGIAVFSDAPDAAREAAAAWDGTAIDGGSALADLWLMRQCRHHIIANSSFSWWGAWLGDDPAGLTIAPRAWFQRDRLITTYVGDLFPDGWVLL